MGPQLMAPGGLAQESAKLPLGTLPICTLVLLLCPAGSRCSCPMPWVCTHLSVEGGTRTGRLVSPLPLLRLSQCPSEQRPALKGTWGFPCGHFRSLGGPASWSLCVSGQPWLWSLLAAGTSGRPLFSSCLHLLPKGTLPFWKHVLGPSPVVGAGTWPALQEFTVRGGSPVGRRGPYKLERLVAGVGGQDGLQRGLGWEGQCLSSRLGELDLEDEQFLQKERSQEEGSLTILFP